MAVQGPCRAIYSPVLPYTALYTLHRVHCLANVCSAVDHWLSPHTICHCLQCRAHMLTALQAQLQQPLQKRRPTVKASLCCCDTEACWSILHLVTCADTRFFTLSLLHLVTSYPIWYGMMC